MALGDYQKTMYNEGTPPGISAPRLNNNENKTAELDTALGSHLAENATTTAKGHVQLTDSVSSTSTSTAATPNSVKQAYDKANAAIPKSLATAANDFLVAPGAGTWVKRTLAEVRTLLSCLLTTGGTMSGELNCARNIVKQAQLKDWTQTVVTDANAHFNESLDLSSANIFHSTITGATTFSFTNPPPSGQVCTFRLFMQEDETLYSVTWPISVTWENHTTPTLSLATMHEFEFVTFNGGLGWYGRLIAKY